MYSMGCIHAFGVHSKTNAECLDEDLRPTQGMLLTVLFRPLMLSLVLLAKLRMSAEKAAMVFRWPLMVRAL